MLMQEMQVFAVPGFAFTPFIEKRTMTFVPSVDHHFQSGLTAGAGLRGVEGSFGNWRELALGIYDTPDTLAETSGFYTIDNCPHNQSHAFFASGIASFSHGQFQQDCFFLFRQGQHRNGRGGSFRCSCDGFVKRNIGNTQGRHMGYSLRIWRLMSFFSTASIDAIW